METAASQATPPPSRWSGINWVLAFIFLGIGLLMRTRFFPFEFSFFPNVFLDQGWTLGTDALLDSGLIPTIDFGYFYGLMMLEINRQWYALCGRTVTATVALTTIGTFLILVGMLRYSYAINARVSGQMLLICAIPITLPIPFPSPLHALEAGLLVNALAFQAQRRVAWALVLVVLAAFLKPGLAYFYGLILGMSVLAGWGGITGSLRERLRLLGPALITLLVLVVGLGLRYGWLPLVNTQFPFAARQVYEHDNYGFFRAGKDFWLLRNQPRLLYLFSPIGFWLAATLLLWVTALRRITQLRSAPALALVSCGILHAIFVFLMFGNKYSWLYYSSLLVCGCVGAIQRRGVAVVFTILAICGSVSLVVTSLQHTHSETTPDSSVSKRTTSNESELWQQVLRLADNERIFVLSQTSGVQQMYPNIRGPKSWFLLRGSVKPGDIERTQAELRQAAYVVVPHGEAGRPAQWPEFADEMAQFTRVAESPSFKLLQRKAR